MNRLAVLLLIAMLALTVTPNDTPADNGNIWLSGQYTIEQVLEVDANITYLAPNIAHGDINGDGFSDFLVPRRNQNGATLFYGGASIVRQTVGFGRNAFAVADFDGDGFDDILTLSINPWNVSIYRGAPSGVEPVPFLVQPIDVRISGGWIGMAVGDFDGDGYDDFLFEYGEKNIIDALFGAATPEDIEMRQYVYQGMPIGSSYSAGVGNLNGDEFLDAAFAHHPVNSILLIYDSSDRNLKLELHGPLPVEPMFPDRMAVVKDVTGDRIDEIVGVNSPRVPAYISYSKDGRLNLTDWEEFPGVGLLQGTNVAPIGDIDGNGFEDFAIGEPSYNHGSIGAAGIVEIYLNSGTDILHSPDIDIIHGLEMSLWVGLDIVPIGDYDGDGRSEFFFTTKFSSSPKIYIVGWNPSYTVESRLMIRPSWWGSTSTETTVGTTPTAVTVTTSSNRIALVTIWFVFPIIVVLKRKRR